MGNASKGGWEGLFPALWTAADDTGRPVAHEIREQVRFLRAAGADGVMALGSTGEFVQFDVPERIEALRAVAEAAEDWPIIANCSDVSLRRVIALGRAARELGVPAISILPPWYFAMNGEDVAEFLIRGAEGAGVPLMLYNFPERTGHRLSLETIAMVCDRVPVIGLKQSGAEFGYHGELAALARERNFTLITGADTRIPDAFALGARGVVSGLSNAIPEPIVAVFRACRDGNPGAAAADQRRVLEFAGLLGGLEFPVDVAAAMHARGRTTGPWKGAISARTADKVATVAARGREMLKGWADTAPNLATRS